MRSGPWPTAFRHAAQRSSAKQTPPEVLPLGGRAKEFKRCFISHKTVDHPGLYHDGSSYGEFRAHVVARSISAIFVGLTLDAAWAKFGCATAGPRES